MLKELLPRAISVIIRTIAKLDIDTLRDLEIAIRSGGHVIVKRAIAEIRRIASWHYDHHQCGKACHRKRNQRTDNTSTDKSLLHTVFP